MGGAFLFAFVVYVFVFIVLVRLSRCPRTQKVRLSEKEASGTHT